MDTTDLAESERLTLESLRVRRHLAAFLGDCGVTACSTCAPRRSDAEHEPTWLRWVAEHRNAKELS